MKGRMFAWAAKQARACPSHRLRGFSSARVGGRRTRSGHDAHPGCLGDALPRPVDRAQLRGRVADALVLSKVRAILGPNLHTIISGGAPLALDLANFYRGLGITLLQGYGLSETTGPISVETPQDFPPDSVGFPWPGNRMKIAPDGELLVQGISVSKGYHNLPEATAEAYVDGWFKTGDIGVNADGFISMADRKKELILSGGFNVYPSQVEAAIRSLPGVADVAVVGVPVADATEEVTAAIIMEEGAQRLTLEQVRKWAEKSIAHYALPRQIVFITRSCRATRWARSCAVRSLRSCARSWGAERASTAAMPRQLVDRCLRLIDRLAEGNS